MYEDAFVEPLSTPQCISTLYTVQKPFVLAEVDESTQSKTAHEMTSSSGLVMLPSFVQDIKAALPSWKALAFMFVL